MGEDDEAGVVLAELLSPPFSDTPLSSRLLLWSLSSLLESSPKSLLMLKESLGLQVEDTWRIGEDEELFSEVGVEEWTVFESG